MGIKNWKNSNGKEKLYLSKTWPDGSRFRRVMPTMTAAKKTLSRIEASIAMGTWRDLKRELEHPSDEQPDPTIAEFAEEYLREYCKLKNRRPDFKKQALSSIKRILGSVKVTALQKAHAYQFIVVRSEEDRVAPATVNRCLAVLKNLLNFAVEKELLERNPLQGFKMLPEPEAALRVMTLEEERRLVDCVAQVDPIIGAYVALLGETGLRKSEGLKLRWSHFELLNRTVMVEMGASEKGTKSGKIRTIPLSDFAIEWIRTLPRIVGVDQVFLRAGTIRPWKDPRGPFEEGKQLAGLDWIGLHDLRHFRATQWVRMGIDIRTVQTLLGHASIQMTMRYSHFAPNHARDEVLRVARREAALSLKVDDSWIMAKD